MKTQPQRKLYFGRELAPRNRALTALVGLQLRGASRRLHDVVTVGALPADGPIWYELRQPDLERTREHPDHLIEHQHQHRAQPTHACGWYVSIMMAIIC